MLEIEGLEYHPLDDAILLLASIFGLHQVLPSYAQAKIWQPWVIGPSNGSKLLEKLLGIIAGFRKFFNYGS